MASESNCVELKLEGITTVIEENAKKNLIR